MIAAEPTMVLHRNLSVDGDTRLDVWYSILILALAIKRYTQLLMSFIQLEVGWSSYFPEFPLECLRGFSLSRFLK